MMRRGQNSTCFVAHVSRRMVITPALTIAVLGLLISTSAVFLPTAHAAPPVAATDQGKAVYEERCAFCHGEKGDGNGPVADTLLPRPRDFTGALFKLTTTKNGTLPTDADLHKTIGEGIHGTAMPAWKGILKDDEIAAVTEYVKTFGGDAWTDDSIKGEPLKIGSPPAVNDALIQQGREIFAGEKAQCVKCHGQQGRGDGPSAKGMEDEWKQPLYPANLHRGWRYKGGNSITDIYTRLTAGVAGSPMPSYADALADSERWAVAAYVQSLQEQTSDGSVVSAQRVAGDLPKTVDDAAWAGAPRLLVPMSGQVVFPPRWQNQSADAMGIQAMFNATDIAFRLSWGDRFEDRVGASDIPPLPAGTTTYVRPIADYVIKHPAYSDQVELQFPTKLENGPARPYFIYGSASSPVVLWHWDAAGKGTAEERTAKGAKAKIEAQPKEGQQVSATGVYTNGQYLVVFTRPRQPADAKDVSFPEGVPVPLAVHAWDGSNGETSWLDAEGAAHNLMAVTAWYSVVLKPQTPSTVYIWSLLAVALVAGGEWWLGRRLRGRKGGSVKSN